MSWHVQMRPEICVCCRELENCFDYEVYFTLERLSKMRRQSGFAFYFSLSSYIKKQRRQSSPRLHNRNHMTSRKTRDWTTDVHVVRRRSKRRRWGKGGGASIQAADTKSRAAPPGVMRRRKTWMRKKLSVSRKIKGTQKEMKQHLGQRWSRDQF